MFRPGLLVLAALCLWLVARPCGAAEGPDLPERAARLKGEVDQLFRQGRYAEAVPRAREALAILEQALGPDHVDVATGLIDLAVLQKTLGEFDQAEPLLRRALAIAEKRFGPEDPTVARSLSNLGDLYWRQGRPDQAEPLFRRALAIREKALGPEHAAVVPDLNGLAEIYVAQGKDALAEPFLRRLAAIVEALLGPEHPAVAARISDLGTLHYREGRYAQAEPLLRRALTIREKALGPEHADVAQSLNNLALVHAAQGRFREAEPLHRRALTIWEKALGPEHQELATGLNNLASLYRDQGRSTEAEPLLRRALAIVEKALGPEDPSVAMRLNSLAEVSRDLARYAQAEPLYRRALAIWEKALGPEHPNVATLLSNLGGLYRMQGQYAQAEPLLRRALAIREKVLGPEHPDVALGSNNLAELYRAQGQYAQAEPLLRRALAIAEKRLGAEHPNVATALSNLASLHDAQGQYAQAEPLLQRALAIREKVLGPDHPDVAISLNNLAGLQDAQGQYPQAEPLYRRALAVWEKALGSRHPNVATGLNNLAYNLDRQQEPALARPFYERARRIQLAVIRSNLDLGDEAIRGLFARRGFYLGAYVRVLAALAQAGAAPPGRPPPFLDAFVVAEQLRSTGAQAALARAGARHAATDAQTAALARHADELRRHRRAVAARLTGAYAPPPGERDAARLASLQQAAAELDRDLAAAITRLHAAVPHYAELAAPDPSAPAEVQRLLRPGEVLVSYLALEDRLLVWVVPPDRPPAYRDLPVAKAGLAARVTGVRRSLETPDQVVDVAGAHALYRTLLGPVAAELAGARHLIVVPDEVLLPLPFGALVTSDQGPAFQAVAAARAEQRTATPAEAAAYARVAWLARDYALTVLPSATALRALRQRLRAPAGPLEPFLGVGDPVLAGRGRRRGGTMVAARGVAVPVAALREMDPLPGTRDELMALAAALGADPRTSLFLGPQATKPVIRQLNATGRLDRARVLAFATHGLIAGEVTGLAEPALLLTPPTAATDEDDGLLGLEDILGLKLGGTEWVILSACNTAAADGSGEGLSGLVRAFFFAGAPSLLVSHWSVDDRATQALMTEVFRRHAADPALPRAEALRRGMLALMDAAKDATAYFAHPYAWAPFFLVGEG